MILLNFAHPLTDEQIAQVESLTDRAIEQVKEQQADFETDEAFGPQVAALVDQCQLSPKEWQTTSILVAPPALNVIAALLIAELHGRMGYFPACLRLKPSDGNTPTRFEVAEVLNLQDQRQAARERRFGEESAA